MPFYEVVTPLRNGGPKPVAPGTIIEMDQDEAEALVGIGALIPRNERPEVIFAQGSGQLAALLGADNGAASGIDPAAEPEALPEQAPDGAGPADDDAPLPEQVPVAPQAAEDEATPAARPARRARAAKARP